MALGKLSEQILERLPRPVWVVDGGGEIAFANLAAAAELGWSDPHALNGLPSHETAHHRHPDGSDYARDDCRVLRHGTPFPYTPAADEWFIRRDGSMFPIAWSCTPIDLPGGPGTIVAFDDVSERRERVRAHRGALWEVVRAELPNPRATPDRDALMGRIRRFVAENATDPDLDPAVVARVHHVSLRLLQALFAETGSSPARFIRDQRLLEARRLLDAGESIARAGALSGFPDPGTFTRAFRRRFGCTPSAFLNGYRVLP
ncbi:helix-turn-helix transcriptional regulator [Cryptosporangium phraense]|uniref:Helix-turn-helix domain-containing protein n=1 Tax=Cryptosporangium phraense TaxID=2593070 RepID=A0A545AQ05_9ACTN|nr:helix-turn-helix domain-containing protein [Cryptosporangium phraense]TQS43412.1 helix-turn-helix domain-containing protein [Cryptosporangium phraense]